MADTDTTRLRIVSDRHHPLREAMGVQPARRLSVNDLMTPVGLLLALCVFAALFPWGDFDRVAGREGTTATWTSFHRKVAPKTVSARFSLCLGNEPVTCVVDGDTIWIEGVKTRIAGIDAPEISRPGCKAEHRAGIRAEIALTEWLNAGPFEVLASPDGRNEDGEDGAKLRVLARGGESAADALVTQGFARRWGGKGKRWC